MTRQTFLVYLFQGFVASTLLSFSAFLAGCRQVLAPEEELEAVTESILVKSLIYEDLIQPGSVADFLRRRGLDVEYSDRIDWDFGSELLFLTRLGQHGEEDYEYFIGGVKPPGAINRVSFNGQQKIVVKRHGAVVWGWKPPVRPDVDAHFQAVNFDGRS
jgi:hypothetical protein